MGISEYISKNILKLTGHQVCGTISWSKIEGDDGKSYQDWITITTKVQPIVLHCAPYASYLFCFVLMIIEKFFPPW